jgi:GDP-4-dehydro-6-deoxy-D-mannose reductase
MRALITGATGFVGRHLADHLAACGDEVMGTDLRASASTIGLDVTDGLAVDGVLDSTRPEVVFHLAGWSDVGSSWRNPLSAFRANAEGTLNVLEAAHAHGVQRVLVVSSADVYGIVAGADLPITEDHPLRPVSPYAASKVAADFLAVQAHLGRGLDTVRARAFNHLGPGQGANFVASALAARIAENERNGTAEVPVGNLDAQRDFTDVRDVVRAYRLLVEHAAAGEAYNICSGRAVAVQELAELLLAQATTPMRLVADPDRYRPVDVPVVLGDESRLRQATGWQPTIPLEQTLADLLAWWRTDPAQNQ